MSIKVLLTGHTGYIGAFLAAYLRNHGVSVFTAGRCFSSDYYFDYIADSSISTLSQCPNIDVIIHLATANEVLCRENSIIAKKLTVDGTQCLINFSQAKKVDKFIYISTFHVFGSNTGLLDESVEPRPINFYGTNHLNTEKIVLSSKSLDTLVLRPSNLIGLPYNWRTFNRWTLAPFDFIKQAYLYKTISLKTHGRQIRNWASMDSLCQAILYKISGKLNAHLVHVPGQDLSILDLAKLVKSYYASSRHTPIKIQTPLDYVDLTESVRIFKSSLPMNTTMPDFDSFIASVTNQLQTTIDTHS